MTSAGEELIAGQVRAVLERDGRNQVDLALAVGLDPVKLSKSLAGRRRFTIGEVVAIAGECGVTVDHLVTGPPAVPVPHREVVAGADLAVVADRLAVVAEELGELARVLRAARPG